VQPDYNAESWEPLKPHFKRPTPEKVLNDLPRDADGELGDKSQVPHYT
jgi:homogentisate 1,2-dioxygenase